AQAVLAEIFVVHADHPAGGGAPHQAGRKERREQLGKQRNERDLHARTRRQPIRPSSVDSSISLSATETRAIQSGTSGCSSVRPSAVLITREAPRGVVASS